VTAPFKLAAFAKGTDQSPHARPAGAANAMQFEGDRICLENSTVSALPSTYRTTGVLDPAPARAAARSTAGSSSTSSNGARATAAMGEVRARTPCGAGAMAKRAGQAEQLAAQKDFSKFQNKAHRRQYD
jgi:hypothetical protein